MTKYSITIFIGLILFACDFETDYKVQDVNGNNGIFFLKNDNIKDTVAREKFNESLKYSQIGDHEKAYIEIKKANEIEPDNVIIINTLALNTFYFDRNFDNKKDYYSLFERAIEIDPSFPYTYSNYAFCLNKNREFKKAVDLLNEGIHLVKDMRMKPIFYYTLAISHLGLNDCEIAKENINKAIKSQKDRQLRKEYKDYRRYILRTCK